MRRAVIVDDEVKSVEVLKMLVESFIEGLEIVGTANEIEEAVSVIELCKPDIVFLDITLKEGDSFQILTRLKKIDFDVVFITAYDEYTVRALKYSGINCLFKPIDVGEFEEILDKLSHKNDQTEEAIEIARELLKSKFKTIPVISDKGIRYISPDAINYFEWHENGSKIYFSDSSALISNKPVQDLTSVLENNRFAAIHSELTLNLQNIQVEKTRPGKLVFKSGPDLKLETDEINKILKMLGN